MRKTSLILAALCITMMSWAQAAYDFSETAATGQTLFFKILDAGAHTVAVCNELGSTSEPFYSSTNNPAGDLAIPGKVIHEAIEYDIVKIDDYAFCKCNDLTSVSFSEPLKEIGYCAFHECNMLVGELNFPNTLTKIGGWAFRPYGNGRSRITAIHFGNSVDSIGEYAFLYQDKVTKLELPNSLKVTEAYAFEKMLALDTVIIGSGIEALGWEAFINCPNLRYIEIHATTPPRVCTWWDRDLTSTGPDKMFGSSSDYNKIPILVPAESYAAYASQELFQGTRLYKIGDQPISEIRFTAPSDLLPHIGETVSVASSESPRHIGDENLIIVADGSAIKETYWTNPYSSILADGETIVACPEDGRKYALWIFYGVADGYYPTRDAKIYLNEKFVDYTMIGDNQFINYDYLSTTPTSLIGTKATTGITKTIRNGQLVVIRDGVRYNAMGVAL